LLISIVIVNYNTGSILTECIRSLYKFEDASRFEIIIVDNKSGDGSRTKIEQICKEHTNIRTIYLDKLQSFSYANNRGIEVSAGDYILIMNPDIIFTEPVFEKLVKLLEKEGTGAVCPALLGKDGVFQFNYFQRYPGIMQYLLFYTFYASIFHKIRPLVNRYLRNETIDINSKQVFEAEQIPCAFFLTPKKILQEAGLLDEKFDLFFEDVDLSYRIHKKFRLEVDTSISVVHIGGASFNEEFDVLMYGKFLLSMNYYFKKNYGKTRPFLLGLFSRINSYSVITFEYVKQLFLISNRGRIEKHKYYLKLLKESS
jgi:GT2 family glycosyltransferase